MHDNRLVLLEVHVVVAAFASELLTSGFGFLECEKGQMQGELRCFWKAINTHGGIVKPVREKN